MENEEEYWFVLFKNISKDPESAKYYIDNFHKAHGKNGIVKAIDETANFASFDTKCKKTVMDGLGSKLDEINNDEKQELRRTVEFRRLLLSTSLGIILGGIISYWLLKVEKPTQVFPIIHQKNQIVHDTFYIASPKTGRDTSLVRLVKLPQNQQP